MPIRGLIPFAVRKTLIWSFTCLVVAHSTTAQSNQWIPAYPGRGFTATAIAVDPGDSRTVFFGTDKGEILRSHDAGASWQNVHLEPGSFSVSSLAIAPSPAPTVYGVFTHSATEGNNFVSWSRVLRSLDGGATWERATNGLRNIGVKAIAVDPFDSSRVYAAGTGGVFRSDDRGRTWSETNNGITDQNIGALVADPSVPRTLYAGVAYRYGALPGGVFRTTDGGLHWTDVGGPLLAENGIIEVRALAAGNNPHTVYASILRQSVLGYTEDLVLKSVDGGETWSRAGDAQLSITGIFVDPNSATTVYVDASSGIYKTIDGGATWNIVPGAFFGPLAIDPNATNTVYCPSAGKTALIAKSEDGGASWTDLAVGLRSPRVTAVAADPAIPTTVYAGTFEEGVFKSTDGGTTWAAANTGLGDLRISLLTIVPWEMPVLFAATRGKEIYRSSDGARTWTLAFRGLPIPFFVVALAGDRSSPGTVYVANGTGVFKTIDFGETWIEADTGLAPADVRSLAVDPVHAGVVYAATAAGVSKSTNAGSTWQDASNGLGGRIGTVIAIDLLDPSVLYLSTSRRELYQGGPATIEVFDIVFRSLDGGGSWVPLNEPRLSLTDLSVTYATRSMAIDPSSGTVYMSTPNAGLIRSRDRGSDWELLNEGLPSGAYALAIGGSSPPMIYAAVGERLFRVSLEETQRLCVSSATALCLNEGQFRVEVSFNARNVGMNGDARTHPITDESGAFWFFSPQNLELVVKVVDGRVFNDRFWVFFAGLSDVEYTLTVTDTSTGFLRTYFNPGGRIASQADAGAFLYPVSATSTAVEDSTTPSEVAGTGSSAGSSLYLNNGRFRVEVGFRTPDGSQSGVGMAVGLTSDTGYFWFFSAGNIELVIKVVDGRPVNGHHWVFYGGLTDVEIAITVTDTVTGEIRNYFKPAGALASEADTAAF
jgi:photosystem II stability/assembly factor-like uncharacterized protein